MKTNETSGDPEITVVVAAYNEAGNIVPAIEEIVSVLKTLEVSSELLVVDDGSTDGTSALADSLAEKHPYIRVLHHGANQGLGGVYRSGFDNARGRYVTFFPADSQFPASIIKEFYLSIGSADMLLGFLPSRRESWVGHLLSTGERALYRLMFGPMPRFQGILMFKRSLLDDLPLQSTGRSWVILIELIMRAARAGYKLENRPITLRPRAEGRSKVNNPATIWASLKQMIRLRLVL